MAGGSREYNVWQKPWEWSGNSRELWNKGIHPHRWEERMLLEDGNSKYRCSECHKAVGPGPNDFCKNPECHVPILLELLQIRGEGYGSFSS